ncbi:hypothetical protein FRC09_000765 [Ceratobasidium sp. 395]|nr:hypothetical protein FRC09_000765 [Ceratobasidium sp. 395]
MTLIKTEETDLAAVKVEESDPTEAIASGIENSEQPTRSRKRRRRARLTRKPKRAWHPWNLLPSERPQYIPEGEALLDDLYESMDASDRHAITVMVLQDREEALEKRLARLEANRLAWQEKNRMRRDGIELVHLGMYCRRTTMKTVLTRVSKVLGTTEQSPRVPAGGRRTRTPTPDLGPRVPKADLSGLRSAVVGLRSLNYSGGCYWGSEDEDVEN